MDADPAELHRDAEVFLAEQQVPFAAPEDQTQFRSPDLQKIRVVIQEAAEDRVAVPDSGTKPCQDLRRAGPWMEEAADRWPIATPELPKEGDISRAGPADQSWGRIVETEFAGVPALSRGGLEGGGGPGRA